MLNEPARRPRGGMQPTPSPFAAGKPTCGVGIGGRWHFSNPAVCAVDEMATCLVLWCPPPLPGCRYPRQRRLSWRRQRQPRSGHCAVACGHTQLGALHKAVTASASHRGTGTSTRASRDVKTGIMQHYTSPGTAGRVAEFRRTGRNRPRGRARSGRSGTRSGCPSASPSSAAPASSSARRAHRSCMRPCNP
jgi:hypothetical protein